MKCVFLFKITSISVTTYTFYGRATRLGKRAIAARGYRERALRGAEYTPLDGVILHERQQGLTSESESESEMFLFDPYQKYIQSNNETILDQGTPTKTSLVANIRAAYYIINNYFFISQAKNT